MERRLPTAKTLPRVSTEMSLQVFCLQHETSDVPELPAHGGNQGLKTPFVANQYARIAFYRHPPRLASLTQSTPNSAPTQPRPEAVRSRRPLLRQVERPPPYGIPSRGRPRSNQWHISKLSGWYKCYTVPIGVLCVKR